MIRIAAFRFAVTFAGFLGLSSLASAQYGPGTSLAPMPPTRTPPANTLPAPIAATPVSHNSTAGRHRAQVHYAGGLLDVRAENSSLNGILHEIAQQTGMKITGGVTDERVFGNYGPAEPATVLATLLDGTGSNMVLRETADNAPKELILTPRTGGPTPPSPTAQNYDADNEAQAPLPPQALPAQQLPRNQLTGRQLPSEGQQTNPQNRPFGPQSIPQPSNNVLGSPSNTTQTVSTLPTYNSVPSDSISTPSVAPPVSGIVDSTNPVPPGSTNFGSSTPTNMNSLGNGTPATPGTAKTPEQIFQQLQQMRQRSQQQQSGSNSSTPQ